MLSAIAATLAIVAIGYFLKQKDFLPDTVWQSLSPLCYWVLFPGLLFDVMTTMELSAAVLGPFTLTIACASVVIVLYAIVAGRAIGMDGPAHSSLVQGSLRHNGFLVLSILQGAFGVAAVQLTAVAIAVIVPISNIVSVIAILVMTGKGGDRGMKRAIVAELLRNPLLLSLALGCGVNLLQIPDPGAILHCNGRRHAGSRCLAASAAEHWRITALLGDPRTCRAAGAGNRRQSVGVSGGPCGDGSVSGA